MQYGYAAFYLSQEVQMSTCSVRAESRYLTTMVRGLIPTFRASLLLLAGLSIACGEDITEPGLAVTVTITTPSGSNTVTFSSVGDVVQLTVEALDANGNAAEGSATWSSSNTQVATVTGTGAVTAVGNGTATITVDVDGVTAQITITVTQVAAAIVVDPTTGTLTALGNELPLTATVQDANGNLMAGQTITWSSNATGVATVSNTGLVTAVTNGTANITATLNTLTATATITVAQVVTSVTVTPPTPNLGAIGATTQLTATAADANGNTVANATFTWTTGNASVATVSATGVVTAVGNGTTDITATSNAVEGSSEVTVTQTVVSIVITPPANQVLNALGAMVQFNAEARDASDNPVPNQTFVWNSSNASVASVDNTGLVTALSNAPANPVNITASIGTISATRQVTVNQLATSVTVTAGGQTTLTALGQTTQLTVDAPDANGNQVTPFTCSSNNTNAVTVTACVVTAVANGQATITATAGGQSGTVIITVAQVPTVLNISPQVLPLVSIGQQGTLTAQLLDERGNVVQGVDVTWTSLNPNTASAVEVTPETTPSTATVTALANGTAQIQASTSIPAPGGLSATAQVPVGQVVDPTMSTATVPNGVAGAATQITIQGKDANGNNIGIGGAVVTLDVTGANTQAGIAATDNGDGTYSASYTPTVIGTDMIAITMDPDAGGPLPSQAILDSPYTSTVAPGIAAAANSTAPNPFPGGVAGEETEFIVTLKDAFNNLVGTDAASSAAVVTATVTSGPNTGAAVAAAATSPADGTWTLSYTPLAMGTDVISVMLDPDGPGPMAAAHIGTDAGLPAGSASPFNSLVDPAIAAAANTSAAVPPGIAGMVTTIVVSLNDANDNPVGTNAASANAAVVGTVTSGPNTGETITSTNNGNGSFNLTYTPVATGTDVIAITLDPDGAGPASADPIGTAPGVPGGPSPFNSVITASGASAAFSSASFSPALPAVAGVPVTITIQSRDPQNNLIDVGGAAVQATILAGGPNVGTNPLDPDGAGPLPAGFFNISAVDETDGTYTIVYTPTVSGGTDQIRITLNGTEIGTAVGVPGGPSPFAALVNPAIANPGASGAVIPAGVAGDLTTGVVTLRDQFGNLVGTDPASANAVVTASVTGGPNNGTALNTVDNGDGTWNISYTPLATGTDVITVNLDPDGVSGATQIGGSPFNGLVAPGLVDPTNTTAAVPAGTAGMVTSITVTMRDANNNLVGNDAASANSSVTANVTGGPNNGTALNTVNNNNGTWTLTYTPAVSDGTNDVIAISLDPDGAGPVAGAAISGSPFNSLVAPGLAQPTTTTAVVPAGQAGSVTTVVVTLRDVNGNPVGTDAASQNAVVTANVTGGPNAGALNAVDNLDGTWNLTYTPLKTGTDAIAIMLDNDGGGPNITTPIANSPFNSVVAPGPVVAARSIATLVTQTVPDITAPGAETEAGDIVSITVQGRDANDNNVTTGTAAVVVTVGGAQPPLQPAVTNAGTGVYTASYVPTVAGVHVITITLDPDAGGPAQPANIGTGGGLNPSPFNATIIPGPPGPVQTTASVPAGLGGVPTTITVTVRDVHSNLVPGVAANLAGSVTGGPNMNTALNAAVEVGGGQYTMQYTPLALGTDVISITVDPDAGGPIAPGAITGSPFNSVVTVGPATAANSTGLVPGGVAGSVTTMTVTLFDGGNNPVGNDAGSAAAVVTSSVSSGPNAGATVTPVNNTDGTWTLTYTPTIIGTDDITIMLDPDGGGAQPAAHIGTAPGRPGGPSPFASLVTPDIAAAATSTAAVPAGTAGLVTSMTVTLRDQFGNLVGNDPLSANADVVGSVTGGPNTGFLVNGIDNLNGTWTLTYTPTGAGTDNITITLDPDGVSGVTGISGSPYNSNVGPAQATAAQTAAVVPAGTAGLLTTAVVTLNDQFGNPVGNDPQSAAAVVAATISSGPNAGFPVSAAPVGNNGTWNLTYTPTAAGTDMMSITLDLDAGGGLPAEQIGGSPYSAVVAPAIAAPAQTTAVVPSGTAGAVTTTVVTLRDAFNNPVGADPASAGALVVGQITSGPNTGATVTNSDQGNGTWNLTYTPTLSGTDVMTITLDPTGGSGFTGIGGSPYATVVAPGIASTVGTTANVPAGTSGLVTSILVTLRDANGNAVGTDAASANAVVAGSVSGGPNSPGAVNAVNNLNGTWTLTYTPALVGTDQITITLDPDGVSGATAINGSPFSSVVSPGAPSPTTTTAAVPGGVLDAQTSITVTLRDAAGNLLTSNGVEVVVANVQTGPNAGTALVAAPNGDGTWTLTYTPTTANGVGTDQIAITLDPDGGGPATADPISGSPYDSIIVP